MKYASQSDYTESRSVLIIPVSKPGDCKLDLQSKHWLTSHTVRGFHQSSWAQLASTHCRNWKIITNLNDKQKLFHKAFNDGVWTGTLFQCVPIHLSTVGSSKQDEKGENPKQDPDVDDRRAWKWTERNRMCWCGIHLAKADAQWPAHVDTGLNTVFQ